MSSRLLRDDIPDVLYTPIGMTSLASTHLLLQRPLPRRPVIAQAGMGI
jgi:hypothetical protein